METVVIAIVCITLLVVGGMTMSQGFIASMDNGAMRFSEAGDRDGDIMRTGISLLTAGQLPSGDFEITVSNSGQVKQANFINWDVIVQYYDASDNYYVKWLPYTSSTPGNDQWTVDGIYEDADSQTAEVFEPNILNPGEEMVIQVKLDPPQGQWTTKYMTVATANGVPASAYLLYLFSHSEMTTISGTDYFLLKSGTPSDGSAITEKTERIKRGATGRWILYNATDSSQLGKHIYPLTGIGEVLATAWTVYYRGQATGKWNSDPGLSIDVIIRKSDGNIRETIATDVAWALLADPSDWQTISATYSFPGYHVVDDTDYLEIDYYGKSFGSGPQSSDANIQLRVDDSSLADTDQTRVEGIMYRP